MNDYARIMHSGRSHGGVGFPKCHCSQCWPSYRIGKYRANSAVLSATLRDTLLPKLVSGEVQPV